MTAPTKFEGWLGLDASSGEGNLVWGEFEPKPWEETDVDIKVTHCGICGSDIHTLRSGWGPTTYPVVVGHEIVGVAVRVGSQVKGIKVGDRVGVGAQSEACLNRFGDCDACAHGEENYCQVAYTDTYNSTHSNGGRSYGGYARYKRCPGALVLKIPDALASEDAAPMLCAGITVYSPLRRHGCGPGKTVGVIGLGGLGHFAVLWARAMGADRVVVVSRSSSKKADALSLGADDFIATAEDPDWEKRHAKSIDLILSTVSQSTMPLDGYLGLLRFKGTFVQLGAPDEGLPGFQQFSLIFQQLNFTGSLIGAPGEIREMLDFAATNNIKPWIQTYPMKDANKALVDFNAGKPRYRFTLVNEE